MEKSSNENFEIWMKRALNLAERSLGRVAPNPAVGCIIVKEGEIVGCGWTQKNGRPHAEMIALEQAKEKAEGADVFTTLEPCSHHGETEPCADALISAKPSRVICALRDPDSRVNGAGIDKIQKAGIEVIENILMQEAAFLNQGYLCHRNQMRPLVTLKTGSTLDGRIATQTGNSRWITNEISRAQAHMLRATYDAIIIGSRTSLSDSPQLTCRLSGLEERTPIRIVADSHLSIPLTSKLVESAKTYPLWVLCSKNIDSLRSEALEQSGAKLFKVEVNEKTGLLDTKGIISILATEGITRLLIEGGSHLAASFINEDLVDRLYWVSANKIIGGDGTPTVSGMGLKRLADAPHFNLLWQQQLGEDTLSILERPLKEHQA